MPILRGRLGTKRPPWEQRDRRCELPREGEMRRTNLFSILAIFVSTLIVTPSARAQQSGAMPPAPTNAPAQPSASAPAPPPTPQAEALQLYRTGKFEEAAGAYTKLAPTDPATAYAGLTRVYLRQKRTDDAYAAINKAVALAPDAIDVRVALAEVYYRQGKILEADRELVKVVNSGGRSARAYLDLARVAETASYYARAKTMIEMAIVSIPMIPTSIANGSKRFRAKSA